MKLNSEIIESIKKCSAKQFVGFEGKVYLNGDLALKEYNGSNVGFINTVSKDCTDTQHIESVLKSMKLSVNLLANKYQVNTPKIIDYFIQNKNFKYTPYILMERVKGEPVYPERDKTIKTLTTKIDGNDIDEKFVNYCKMLIEKLSDADQSKYDKFAVDCMNIERSSNVSMDVFGENYCFDEKKGFSILDLQILSSGRVEYDKYSAWGKTCSALFNYILNLRTAVARASLESDGYEQTTNKIKPVVEKSYNAIRGVGITNEDMIYSYFHHNKVFKILDNNK